MIGYGAIFIVVIACVIVSLPILLVSLFLAVLFSKLFEKRTTYLISFIGLLASVTGLYFWSYPPLLQSLAVWKGMMPDWIKKAEDIMQNGQPFHMTYQSYFLSLFISITLVRLWVMIGKALGKNWFTKEKEQEKDDYLESDKYKRIDKKSSCGCQVELSHF